MLFLFLIAKKVLSKLELQVCKTLLGLYFAGINCNVWYLLSVPFPELFIEGFAALKKRNALL
ncbi:hypothetical protein [Polaribacter ponticola]|uniref:Uncharacterized protein n=1 Tax=Polaribacter ponticola TaxID=2978475 RepID=A0ABT5S8R4_9FLAO|nr:hypothetical protein [Polaribacter sp. MSW5]MDD7914501.1 hypothetical protein [Polaribacter sp. MSW5]